MIALSVSILTSNAAADNEPRLSATISAQLNEPAQNAGDNAVLQVKVVNAEAPILDGYLVVDIVKRDSSNENVIAEITTRDII
ncbi:hypothetical protein HYU12_05545, partial [Candidatus Woesearchaeota archaeon]|nr:hypothetical protein [Candidatus Woesearchaeota archaeon]